MSDDARNHEREDAGAVFLVHQLVVGGTFDNIKMHGTIVKISG
jgi:hypothetical protein